MLIVKNGLIIYLKNTTLLARVIRQFVKYDQLMKVKKFWCYRFLMKSKGQFIMLFMCGLWIRKVSIYCSSLATSCILLWRYWINFKKDTTRYQLNNESLTFGVGTNFAPHSNNVSFSEQQINLYEQQIEKVENHQLLNLIN